MTWRFWVRIIGLLSLTSMFAAFTYTFIIAYQNGGSTRVHINNYGEANLELALLALSIIPVGIVIFDCIKLLEGEKI